MPGATMADAAGGGMQAAMAIMAALIGRGQDGAGHPPRRVHRRRGAVADLAGRRRAPGHRRRSARARAWSPAATPATTPTGRPTGGGWRSGPSSRSSSPTCAGSSAASSGCAHQLRRRGPGRDPGRLPGRLRHPGPRRLGGRAGRRRHLRGAGAVGGRAGRRRAVRGPPRIRRGGHGPLAGGAAPPIPPGRRRCWPAWTGRDGPGHRAPIRRETDTDQLLAAAGVDPTRIAELRAKGVVA